ncbi:gastrula zinc finger protein XlCGF71.1-like [Octopus sinensis]|uniref:Gastrula zinc finger protein XlCGF71.1-like n=1 Tax=Octopus sinensis TaxID=2607531 RepID=A0A7E6FBF5_9MOLL|nr:gastrula zinc finger protein XlCGF71.1-like [Octopus sinensis]
MHHDIECPVFGTRCDLKLNRVSGFAFSGMDRTKRRHASNHSEDFIEKHWKNPCQNGEILTYVGHLIRNSIFQKLLPSPPFKNIAYKFLCNHNLRPLKAAMNLAEKKSFHCFMCQMDFVSEFTLQVHQRFHHKPKSFHCYVCNKDFLNNSYLKMHKASHTAMENSKQFNCTSCDKTFVSDFTLKLHQLLHSTQKPFHCEVCDKDFLNDFCLVKHKKLHGKKTFQCPKCEQNFSKLLLLKLHLKLHFKRNFLLQSRMKRPVNGFSDYCSREYTNHG